MLGSLDATLKNFYFNMKCIPSDTAECVLALEYCRIDFFRLVC